MKKYSFLIALTLIANLGFSSSALALGEKFTVFEATSFGGFWDHDDEFYFIGDLKGVGTFVRGSFGKSVDPKIYTGEIFVNEFSPNEIRIKATATLIHESGARGSFSNKKIFILKVNGIKQDFIIQKN